MKLVALVVALLVCSGGHARAQSAVAPYAESRFIPALAANLSVYNVSEPAIQGTVISPETYGCVGDGATDDTTCLNTAMAAIPTNGTLKLTPGRIYRHTNVINMTVPNTEIWGDGAILYADMASVFTTALDLQADHTHAFKLTITSNLNHRVSATLSAGIHTMGDDHLIIDNRFEYTGTCTFVQSTHTIVLRNVCYRDWADGYTAAGGVGCACAIDHIIVAWNIVYQNGDDSISIVNYADTDDQAPFITDITVEHNVTIGNFGGSPVAVHGGKNIYIGWNTGSLVSCGVGIDVDSEVGFLVRNVSNVLVEHNIMTDVQTVDPAYAPNGAGCAGGTGLNHGGFYTQAGNGHHLDSVLWRYNRLERALRKGAQIQATGTPHGVITNIGYLGNQFIGVQDTLMALQDPGVATCDDNKTNDWALTTSANCGSTTMPTVTGSGYHTR